MTAPYPASASERTRWIIERRGARNPVRADRPYACFNEAERASDGEIDPVATVFLTNRECPWKCVMCDLWQNTTLQPGGDIPGQIRYALTTLRVARVLKLYNSGSFFDPGAIPPSTWAEIAGMCRPFQRVIVECHPRLVGPPVVRFRDLLTARLEIALGLETAHPAALSAINKRITVEDYGRACEFLSNRAVDIRTFLLINPPFVAAQAQHEWLLRSVECAVRCGSQVISLIPLRAGNGAVEDLIARGEAREPSLPEIEHAQEAALRLISGEKSPPRIFADTWDLARFSLCASCLAARVERIEKMNNSQQVLAPVQCLECHA